jgi:NAD(P)-dependent dehydrogenase (short-subunit alcohol dehydrogenase family)
MSALRNVIVIGGSGNVGREILSSLLARKDEFGTISALKREGYPTSDVLQKLAAQGVHVLEADLKDKASLVKAFKGILSLESEPTVGADVVISTVNVPAFEDQYTFLDAAIEAKYTLHMRNTDGRVKRFIPSEFGSNTNLLDVASISYLQPKIKFAHHLEHKAKEGLIDYTLINTGPSPIAYLTSRRFPRIRHQNRFLRTQL